MDQILPALLEKGILGVIIIVLLLVARTLYNDQQKSQEQRIEETRAHGMRSIEAIEKNTSVLTSLTELIKQAMPRN